MFFSRRKSRIVDACREVGYAPPPPTTSLSLDLFLSLLNNTGPPTIEYLMHDDRKMLPASSSSLHRPRPDDYDYEDGYDDVDVDIDGGACAAIRPPPSPLVGDVVVVVCCRRWLIGPRPRRR